MIVCSFFLAATAASVCGRCVVVILSEARGIKGQSSKEVATGRWNMCAFGVRAGPQLLQGPGGATQRSLQTAKPVLYVLPDCLYTIPAGKPCSGPASSACSIPGQCTDSQLPGGCCQVGFTCTCAGCSLLAHPNPCNALLCVWYGCTWASENNAKASFQGKPRTGRLLSAV